MKGDGRSSDYGIIHLPVVLASRFTGATLLAFARGARLPKHLGNGVTSRPRQPHPSTGVLGISFTP